MEPVERLQNTFYERLKAILCDIGRLAVAFSGGVDSSLLLHIASDILGDSVIALTAISKTTPRQELENAIAFAGRLRVQHFIVETHEMDIPDFIRNPPDRCYVCKKHRYELLAETAVRHGFKVIADGENMDDQSDYRPGSRAARELGIRKPLCEAGLNKNDIRKLSREAGLTTWNKPALACLASRIPYNSIITAEKLIQIDAAEDILRLHGFSAQVRIRHFGDTVRIELDPQDISRLIDTSMRNRIIQSLKELGFLHILLDLEGYRMGSMNDAL